MERETWYRALWAYLRPYMGHFAVLALGTAIFGAVFALYGLPLEAVAYAAGLCLLAGCTALALRYPRARRARQERRAALDILPEAAGPLPEASCPEGDDFRAMAEKLRRSYAELMTKREAELQESRDYYATWVHQIKTPIAVMQMTLQAEDTPENRALLGELFRIRQYAEMALNYIRLESDSSDLVIRTVALDGVIRQAVRRYAPQFVQKRLALRYEPTAETALTDEKWLLFILEQLLSNAVKYTPAGSVTIAVTAGPVLSVTDTGIGIAAEDLPRIFEKGFTGYNGRTDKSATGLGLYLCRMTAQKLRHRLWAESVPGRGSTFYLDLRREELVVE